METSNSALDHRLEAILGSRVAGRQPLHGGCIAEVLQVTMADGRVFAVKHGPQAGGTLQVEGCMLAYLRQHSAMPVPEVYHASPDLLVMAFLPGNSQFSPAAEADCARHVALLHAIRGPHFGFAHDTLIGPLRQPNPPHRRWADFFAEARLLHMGAEARRAGSLPPGVWARVQALAARVGDFVEEPVHPALLHGDLWTTNVLALGGQVTGFLDPAIYFGHPEMDLAYATLFQSFGAPFFARYQETCPISPGFFETRRDLYNLYPLLVHVRLFGGGYVPPIQQTLRRLGF